MIRGFCSDLPASGIARNLVSPATVHSAPNTVGTGLDRKIGSVEAAPIRIPGAAPWGAASYSLTGDNCGRAVEYLRRDRSFISLRSELGGDPAQNFTYRRPSGGLAFHGFNHEGRHDHKVVKACQGLGNVCRA